MTNVLDEVPENDPIDVANTVDLDDKGEPTNDEVPTIVDPIIEPMAGAEDGNANVIIPEVIELDDIVDGVIEDHEHEEGEH